MGRNRTFTRMIVDDEFKALVIQEFWQAGASIAAFSRAHCIIANTVDRWLTEAKICSVVGESQCVSTRHV